MNMICNERCCKTTKCNILHNCNNIRVLAWNIQGLDSEVIHDEYFNECLDTNDIIILTETWLEEKMEIRPHEFYCFNKIRPKHARAFRPSGGISVLVRHELRGDKTSPKGIQFLKDNDYFVWFKICKEYFMIETDIFICAAYIPPS
jgi:exonuclease III